MTVEEQVRKARAASRTLASLSRARKDEALELIAEALRRRAGEILAENAEDVALARANKVGAALVDRLYLDEDRLKETARSVREIAGPARPRRRDRGRSAPAERPRAHAACACRWAWWRSSTRRGPT